MANGDEPPNVRYRRLAQDCLDLLPSLTVPDEKNALIEMARTWRVLAELHEGKTQSLTQQQQQIQSRPGDDANKK